MIIEFVDVGHLAEPGDLNKVIFVHINPRMDKSETVKRTCGDLSKAFPNFGIFRILNGQLCPNNPLPKITVFNRENRPLLEAIETICDISKGLPGQMIPLSAEQMEAYTKAQAEGDLLVI